jgi:hypothetical protein
MVDLNDYAKNNTGDDFPGEIYKPVRFMGAIWNKYIVSQYGTIIGPAGKKLKWSHRSKNDHYPRVSLRINDEPTAFMKRLVRDRIDGVVHRIVAETHLPISENLPYEFHDIRRYLTQDHFNILERLFIVDHIDGDKGNPCVDNLQWITHYNNNHVNKKIYMQGL